MTVRGDSQVATYGDVTPAEERDFAEEYLSLDLAVAVVDSLDAALQHIRRYSTGHSETIITESQTSAARFLPGGCGRGIGQRLEPVRRRR